MIYFITRKKEEYSKLIDTSLFDNITILDEKEGKQKYYDISLHHKNAYVDIEATGLDPYKAELILLGIMFKSRYTKHYFMFDWTCTITDIVEDLRNHYIIGHNLKYDIKLLKTHTIVPILKNLYDTMIAEQRLYMGTGYGFAYNDLVERYQKEIVIKTTRDEFINANLASFKINVNHLLYLKRDLELLPEIKQKQKRLIHKWKMQFLIYGIENPLVAVIANAELIGFKLNTEKWLKRIETEINKKYEILIKLDNIVKTLKNTLTTVNKDLLSGGKWNKQRVRSIIFDEINTNGTVNVPNLFGDVSSSIDYFRKGKSNKVVKQAPKIEEYSGCVNYTKAEVIHIFGALNQPAITEGELFSIPKFTPTGKVENFNYYSVKEQVLERYLILKPNSVMREFLETFRELQKVSKALSTYGKTFIDKINDRTGKIHTIFRQCFADTGRMQSGGGKKEPDKYNAQNLPRDKAYREPFEGGEGYLINTADYSGAELIVMASHAQDHRLLELSKGDMHSHFATKSWRSIYKNRANKHREILLNTTLSQLEKEIYEEEYEHYLELSNNFTVTKDNPKGYRQTFKPMAFGVIYGLFAKKAGKTLNVSTEEGQIVINTIKREIPKTIKMVENQSAFAEKYGYVLHNNRTNSRRWFPILIKQLKKEVDKDSHFIEISEALSAARNSTIQGTQADFVKEASVKLQYYYWKNNIDADILSWVHDEIVDKIAEDIVDTISESKHKIMVDVANKYLHNVEIDCEMTILPHWTK